MKVSLKFGLLVLMGILLLSNFSCSVMTGGTYNTTNAPASPPKNVVLIGWDGAQRNQ